VGDNGIAITTGSAATSITASGASDLDATALAEKTTLTLVGCGGDSERPGRQHHGQFAHRGADRGDGGCRR